MRREKIVLRAGPALAGLLVLVLFLTLGCQLTAPKATPTAVAAEATAIFHKYRIDELPVINADARPVGLIDVQDVVAIKIVG